MSRRAGEPRCCVRCGRWGNRAFRPAGNESSEGWECINDRTCKRRANRPLTIAELAQQLIDGIEGKPLYDAWSGVGWWTPKVRLTERDALIVATWAHTVLRPEAGGDRG